MLSITNATLGSGSNYPYLYSRSPHLSRAETLLGQTAGQEAGMFVDGRPTV